MIVIINGSVGVGKTSTAWGLQEKFEKSIMLDGDYIGAVHPFEIYDDARINYLYDTLCHLIKFHISNGYKDFVINYVFESQETLNNLIHRFDDLNMAIYPYWLSCSNKEQKKRILLRSTDQKEWELKRFVDLNLILEKASGSGFIGKKIVTDGKSIQEITELIWKDLQL